MRAGGRRLAQLLALALLAGACSTNGGEASFSTTEPRGAQVEAVLDGDSLAINLDGAREEVRLLGVNAPERDECYDREAKQKLQDLIDTETIELSAEDTDRFDRILAYVTTASGVDVNLELVKAGATIALSSGHERQTEFKSAEADAFASGIGRWQAGACGDPDPAAGVRIDRINEDAPGDDGFNRNGEWVRIANDGSEAVNVSGWGLADESSQHRFTFPDGSRLEAGGTITIYSGAGNSGGDEYYWDAADPVWSNRGDTAYLSDRSGNIVARLGY